MSLPSSSSSLPATDSNSADSVKGSNVTVIVRCRPPTESERRAAQSDVGLVECRNGNEVTIHYAQQQRHKNAQTQNAANKTYTFDAAYGPASTQSAVYAEAVQPLVAEVLNGFNCTVFAYGQTGTGKTYTMEGELTSDVNSRHAGVIPRAVHTIFDSLERSQVESSVKVSFLEIYNEELSDLLADDVEAAERTELRIFEDVAGKKGMAVHGLEEVLVTSADQVFTLLQRSWQKRRTAETLLNKNSSRSHCVFIVTVHSKECDDDGEDIIRTGKLYLVDLAGSECVGKSGAQQARAKEAGNINKSLLTLGRVINTLVDKGPYVPYRDSKLTRLLQESLGGRAKTVIIATVSPSSLAIDETISTLDYAHRAKHIRNRPQVNQKISKRAYMKELQTEIASLKRENECLRLKNGIFLPPEKYDAMMAQSRGDTLRVEELLVAIKAKESDVATLTETVDEKQRMIEAAAAALAESEERRQQTADALLSTSASLQTTSSALCERTSALRSTTTALSVSETGRRHCEWVIEATAATEETLRLHAESLADTAASVVEDTVRLHSANDRRSAVETSNASLTSRTVSSVRESAANAIRHGASLANATPLWRAEVNGDVHSLQTNAFASADRLMEMSSANASELKKSVCGIDGAVNAFVDTTRKIGSVAAATADAARCDVTASLERVVRNAEASQSAVVSAVDNAAALSSSSAAHIVERCGVSSALLKSASAYVKSAVAEVSADIALDAERVCVRISDRHDFIERFASDVIAASASDSRALLEVVTAMIDRQQKAAAARVESALETLIAAFQADRQQVNDESLTRIAAVRTIATRAAVDSESAQAVTQSIAAAATDFDERNKTILTSAVTTGNNGADQVRHDVDGVTLAVGSLQSAAQTAFAESASATAAFAESNATCTAALRQSINVAALTVSSTANNARTDVGDSVAVILRDIERFADDVTSNGDAIVQSGNAVTASVDALSCGVSVYESSGLTPKKRRVDIPRVFAQTESRERIVNKRQRRAIQAQTDSEVAAGAATTPVDIGEANVNTAAAVCALVGADNTFIGAAMADSDTSAPLLRALSSSRLPVHRKTASTHRRPPSVSVTVTTPTNIGSSGTTTATYTVPASATMTDSDNTDSPVSSDENQPPITSPQPAPTLLKPVSAAVGGQYKPGQRIRVHNK